MGGLNKFQIIVLGIFSVAIIGTFIYLALNRGLSGGGSGPPETVVWGTIDEKDFSGFTEVFQRANRDKASIIYRQKSAVTLERDLIEAIADGRSPDVIIFPSDFIISLKQRIAGVPYKSYPRRVFKDTFVEAGGLFLDGGGVIAYPLLVDPLVMYWNRDVIGSVGLASPPRRWSEFLTLPEKVVNIDNAGNLTRTAVALGDFENVTNAKEILSALFLQVGQKIVVPSGAGFAVTLEAGDDQALESDPSEASSLSVVRFFTEFADPLKPQYSWNRSLPESREVFSRGDLAVYFGFASELELLRAKNPNLNFDVAFFPQLDNALTKAVFGRVYAAAAVKHTRSPSQTFKVLGLLASRENVLTLSQMTRLPPARRDLLAVRPADDYQYVFYDAALVSKGWYDPNPEGTKAVFRKMVESVTSGRLRISDALRRAAGEITKLLSAAQSE